MGNIASVKSYSLTAGGDSCTIADDGYVDVLASGGSSQLLKSLDGGSTWGKCGSTILDGYVETLTHKQQKGTRFKVTGANAILYLYTLS